ncbi:MAG TPA: hypothetical protein EYG01_02970 [Flavobacteriales bacterium]|nr:hypothetical protein [Flavobacteriales bacterium]
MKKITLMLLVAIVPFLSMAQKGSKVEYMMIKGIEIQMNNESADQAGDVREMALGSISSENTKLIVAFDYGDLRNAEVKAMTGKRFRTMMSAVNTAAEKGWEFINSNVISADKMKIHYYYMKRNKKK